jgi:hypothetical protein
MLSAVSKMMRISYRLFWIALIAITAGAWALAFHFVSLRLVRSLWRVWRRQTQRALPEAGRKRQMAEFGKRVNTAATARHVAVRDEGAVTQHMVRPVMGPWACSIDRVVSSKYGK